MYTEISNFLRGYKDNNGTYHTEFEFREMTGEDEEAISKPSIRKNGSVIVRTILERCIVRIGTITKDSVKTNEWQKMIQELAVGDQDIALMEIRRISLGDEIEVTHKCPNCKTKIDSVFTIDELPFIQYGGKDEIEFELPKGYVDKEGNLHKEGKLRIAIGLDREYLNSVATQNIGSANTLLLARCIQSIGNVTLTDKILKSLSVKDRNFLFKLIRDNFFGYDISNFEIECPNCATDLSISLNQTDFF